MSLKWKETLDAGFGHRSFSGHKVKPIYDEDPHEESKISMTEPETLRKASHELCCMSCCKARTCRNSVKRLPEGDMNNENTSDKKT